MNVRFFAIPLMCLAATAFAQNADHAESPKPEKFYKLQIKVDQFEASKLLKSQEVVVTVPLGRTVTHIRSGEKIPYYTTGSQGMPTSYQDVGLNVDCRNVEELASGLSLALEVQVSAAVAGDAGKLPLIRQYSWESNVLVPLSKPAIIYSDTDSNSQYKMEVKVTATPLDLR